LTGVSSFPNLDEVVDAPRNAEKQKIDCNLNPVFANDVSLVRHDFVSLIKTASEGGTPLKLSEVFSKTQTVCDPLKKHRLGEAYERLRDQSDRWLELKGSRPLALIICLGTQSDYTPRLNFSKNYLAAGGIESCELNTDPLKLKEAIDELNGDLTVVSKASEYTLSEEQITVKSPFNSSIASFNFKGSVFSSQLSIPPAAR
jgi:hypothetical protein